MSGERARKSKEEQSMLKYVWSIKSIHVSRFIFIHTVCHNVTTYKSGHKLYIYIWDPFIYVKCTVC